MIAPAVGLWWFTVAALAQGPTAATAPAPAAPMPMHLRAAGTPVGTGAGRGEVLEPAGIAVDAFGRVTYTDAALHRVQRIDAEGRWLGESGVLGSDPGQLRRPGDVALLGTLGVAVLDRENRRVSAYDLFGRFTGVLIDLEAGEIEDAVGRVDPVALATDAGGALYVADADRDRILAFDFSGRFLRSLGGFGERVGSFRGLAGLAVTPKGELVTTERSGARVQRLDAGGRPVATWPLEVSSRPGSMPVAVDDSLRIAVADEVAGVLWVFDATGRILARHDALLEPRALAFASDGSLLVAEAGRISRFVLERGRPRSPRGP